MQTLNDVKSFFNERAAHWDETCYHDPEKIKAILNLAKFAKGKRILDVACGTGVLFPYLLEKDPAEIVGVDVAENMIAIARSKFDDPRLTLIADDLFQITLTGFDYAIIYSAYPHFPDKKLLVDKISNLLVSKGRFIIAHSESRDTINQRHHGPAVSNVSSPLLEATEEAKVWENAFLIDTLADTSDSYIISGTKK